MSFRPDLGFVEAGRNLDSAGYFEEALRPGGQARVLPPVAFRSLPFLKLEDEAIWTRQWICIGLDSQIPAAGDLLPFTVGEHGIHVQRKTDGSLIGRFNQAQHGGCRVVPLQCQGGTKTRCSFTSCGHSRDRAEMAADELGRQAPVMHQYLGLRPERLLKVPTAHLGPLIFVNLDEAPPPFDVVAADAPALGRLGDAMAGAAQGSAWIEFDANWKLVAQALAAGTPAQGCQPATSGCAAPRDDAPTSPDSPWLRTESDVQGRRLCVDWLFPNLVLLRAAGQIAVVILQPTAIGKTLCRVSVHQTVGATPVSSSQNAAKSASCSAAARSLAFNGAQKAANDAALDAFWTAELARRGSEAERWQTQTASPTLQTAPQRDPVGDWMQRTLARTIIDRKPRWTDVPLFNNRRS